MQHVSKPVCSMTMYDKKSKTIYPTPRRNSAKNNDVGTIEHAY